MRTIKIVYLWPPSFTLEVTATLPARFEVCSGCGGEGTELGYGLKGLAFSAEQMNEDPDFRESYFRGDFDRPCSTCSGRRVELVPDAGRMTFRELRRFKEWKRYKCECAHDDYADKMTQWQESGCPRDDCGPIYPEGY
ncbi:MAG: hypothetical protein GTN64_05535 [Candidatus Latescibacteria bacterium]|nr:hypothetical protein [Candidatus Latescibacterota bacterium]NIO78071.1 hypothetical protein [Candidatus Latescibacterota bacterium]